jgi:hypothetical protein
LRVGCGSSWGGREPVPRTVDCIFRAKNAESEPGATECRNANADAFSGHLDFVLYFAAILQILAQPGQSTRSSCKEICLLRYKKGGGARHISRRARTLDGLLCHDPIHKFVGGGSGRGQTKSTPMREVHNIAERPVLMGQFSSVDSTGDGLPKKIALKALKALKVSFSCAGLPMMGALLHDFDRQNVTLLTARTVSYMDLRPRVRP